MLGIRKEANVAPRMSRWLIFLIVSIVLHPGLQANVNLLNPESGDIYQAGDVLVIEWEILTVQEQENWDIFISYDGGAQWEELASDLAITLTSYHWIVPDIESEEVQIRIVQDNIGTDYEDQSGNFTVIRKEDNPIVTGLDINSQAEFSIYPNPFKQKINILLADDSGLPENIKFFTIGGKNITDDFFLINQKGNQFELELLEPLDDQLILISIQNSLGKSKSVILHHTR